MISVGPPTWPDVIGKKERKKKALERSPRLRLSGPVALLAGRRSTNEIVRWLARDASAAGGQGRIPCAGHQSTGPLIGARHGRARIIRSSSPWRPAMRREWGAAESRSGGEAFPCREIQSYSTIQYEGTRMYSMYSMGHYGQYGQYCQYWQQVPYGPVLYRTVLHRQPRPYGTVWSCTAPPPSQPGLQLRTVQTETVRSLRQRMGPANTVCFCPGRRHARCCAPGTPEDEDLRRPQYRRRRCMHHLAGTNVVISLARPRVQACPPS